MGTKMVSKILSSIRESSVSNLRTFLAHSFLSNACAHSAVSQESSVDMTKLQERTCGQDAQDDP